VDSNDTFEEEMKQQDEKQRTQPDQKINRDRSQKHSQGIQRTINLFPESVVPPATQQ